MYAVRIKVDKILPWIELERTYTYREARNAAEEFPNNMQMKIVTIPKKPKQEELRAQETRREGSEVYATRGPFSSIFGGPVAGLFRGRASPLQTWESLLGFRVLEWSDNLRNAR